MSNDSNSAPQATNSKPRVKAKTVIPVVPADSNDVLYEIRKKIYPRSVSGRFATWRWILVWFTQIVFYGFSWLDWNGRQAVLFDLAARKFYVFGLVFWPQDVFYLAVLLIICAYALFLFTAVAGRLWCGYACPQTVYTEMFLWLEEKIEGDRSKRMKLDAAQLGLRKIAIKTSKHVAWTLLALWTGISFVGYFTPIRSLLPDLLSWRLGGWEVFWILFYGGFTYLLAGMMREQVCKYMCPYARFQGVMFDPDTLTITYDTERGEPRGSRKKSSDYKAQGLGDCVDCGICVQVCPTGIDIRQGLQYECIGCAACIDACDQVMDKMAYPKGLIRYTTEHALERHWGAKDILAHVLRPRTLIYSGVLCAITVAFVWGIAARSLVRMDVIRDRGTLAREVEDGMIENIYTLQVMNVSEIARQARIDASGIDGIRIVGDTKTVIGPGGSRSLSVRVQVPGGAVTKGSHQIFFELHTADNAVVLHEKSTFLMQ